ncbi:MAG: S46 family peptidase [Acidobacteria bacterium]|nr:S46 family peptidase [Acidobacteriota bacterium]
MKKSLWHSRLLALLICVSLSVAVTGAPLVLADEGMWTFDNPPVKQLEERYGFTPTPEWLDHVRLSSVRFNDGGSGSFVSPNGLALTNHHVARGQLQKVSSPQRDYVKDGFYAATQAEELKCPDLELNVLVSMENVTARVQGAVKKGMTDKEALDARKAEIAKIEKESLQATGLRSDVVTLYQGSECWLYRYKKYTDVRLVFAPEQQIAFYGGDPDNFTYPRYDLDVALFRVYENGQPVQTQHYLKWNAKGATDGELVFVSGHPGRTDRLQTMAQIELERDHLFPLTIKGIKRRLAVLRRYAAGGPEQARQTGGMIFGLENSLKAYTGYYNGLLDKNVIAKKQKEEAEFRALVASKPEWKKEFGDAWDMIAAAEKKQLEMLKPMRFRTLSASRLAGIALTIVQYVAEVKKPDGQRLDGFHDSQLESLKFRLFSPAPVYPGMEEAPLADSLQESLEELGPDDPFIKAPLNGRPAAEVAKELIAGTKLADPAFRKSLVEGGEAAVAASTDPMIVVARKVDPLLREMRKWLEDNVLSVEVAAGEKIGKARFAAYGKSAYPDATFTLRLSYGAVKSYPMNGTIAPPKTTFYGLYDRAHSFDLQPPFHLPARYVERKDKLDLSTPLNFVSTCDIIGGNSGSPVINRNAEFVGVIFDGNIESLAGRFVYNDEANRAVAVHSAAIIEALRKLYDAEALADELEGTGSAAMTEK